MWSLLLTFQIFRNSLKYLHYSQSSMSQGEHFQTDYDYFRLSSQEEGSPLQTQQRFTNFPPPGHFPLEKAIWVKTILILCEGESLTKDGFFEPAAWTAIRRFQQKSSLPTTGGFDDRTLIALTQRALNVIQQSNLPITGIMDNKTRQEIIRFQSSKFLAQNGIVSHHTRRAMVLSLEGSKPKPTTPAPQPGFGPLTVRLRLNLLQPNKFPLDEIIEGVNRIILPQSGIRVVITGVRGVTSFAEADRKREWALGERNKKTDKLDHLFDSIRLLNLGSIVGPNEIPVYILFIRQQTGTLATVGQTIEVKDKGGEIIAAVALEAREQNNQDGSNFISINLAHELGHALGLDHVEGTSETRKTKCQFDRLMTGCNLHQVTIPKLGFDEVTKMRDSPFATGKFDRPVPFPIPGGLPDFPPPR